MFQNMENSKIDVVVRTIYNNCEDQEAGTLKASILLNFIKPFLEKNNESLEQLRQLLDPENIDPVINRSSFYEKMIQFVNFFDEENGTEFIAKVHNSTLSPRSLKNMGSPDAKSTPIRPSQRILSNTFVRSTIWATRNFDTSELVVDTTKNEERINELEFLNKNLVDQNDRYQIQLGQYEEQMQSLREKVTLLEKQLTWKQELVDNMKSVKINASHAEFVSTELYTQRQVDTIRKKLEDADKEVLNLKKHIQITEFEKQQCDQKCSNLKFELEEANKNFDQLKLETSERTKELWKLKDANCSLVTKLEEQESLVDNFKLTIETLRNEKEKIQSKLNSNIRNLMSLSFSDPTINIDNRVSFNSNGRSCFENPSLLRRYSTPGRIQKEISLYKSVLQQTTCLTNDAREYSPTVSTDNDCSPPVMYVVERTPEDDNTSKSTTKHSVFNESSSDDELIYIVPDESSKSISYVQNSLKEEILELQSDRNEINNATFEHSFLLSEIKNVKHSLHEKKLEVSNLESTNTNLNEQVEYLKERTIELEEHLNNTASKYRDEIHFRENEYLLKIKSLEQELQEVNLDNQNVKLRLEELKHKDEILKQRDVCYKNLSESLNNANDTNEKLRMENINLLNKIKSLEDIKQELTTKLSEDNCDSSSSSSSNQLYNSCVRNHEYKMKQKTLNQLNAKILKLESRIDDLNDDKDILQMHLDVSLKDHQDTSLRYSELSEKMNNLLIQVQYAGQVILRNVERLHRGTNSFMNKWRYILERIPGMEIILDEFEDYESDASSRDYDDRALHEEVAKLQRRVQLNINMLDKLANTQLENLDLLCDSYHLKTPSPGESSRTRSSRVRNRSWKVCISTFVLVCIAVFMMVIFCIVIYFSWDDLERSALFKSDIVILRYRNGQPPV